MDLKSITVTDVHNVITVYSEKGRYDTTVERKFYGLSLCKEGQITYVQNGVEYVSDKDCAVLLPQGGSYRIRRERTGLFPVINFTCLEPLSETITVIPVQNAEELIADYERMKKLLCFGGNRAQILSIFYGMLHKLSSDGIPYELRGAMQLISSDYCDSSLTNEALAAQCNMSAVYFRKLFTKHLGTSPKQFVIDVRIQKAKQMLAEGAESVSLISEKCGFSNPYHFCRTFKQKTGITPLEYRKANPMYEI
jgi:AraC-like DNA-binding protein